MIEELVTRAFDSRNAAHIAHWKTKSYAVHVALGSFYDEVIDLVDSLVEAYQGAFGLIDMPSLPRLDKVPEDIVPKLEDDLLFISKNRPAIVKGLPSLDNLLQSVEDLYLSTIYKLKNLH